eukprot:gene3930-15348_t
MPPSQKGALECATAPQLFHPFRGGGGAPAAAAEGGERRVDPADGRAYSQRDADLAHYGIASDASIHRAWGGGGGAVASRERTGDSGRGRHGAGQTKAASTGWHFKSDAFKVTCGTVQTHFRFCR